MVEGGGGKATEEKEVVDRNGVVLCTTRDCWGGR